jgi:hypothetical protein
MDLVQGVSRGLVLVVVVFFVSELFEKIVR